MPLSAADLNHLTDARRAIEPLVLRQAIEHGGVAWESEVLAAHHRLERTPQMAAGDPGRLSDDWTTAHADYHNTLLAGCPNPRLLAIAGSLRDAAELYRRWSVALARSGRDIAAEHRAILDAILAHDAGKATAALATHIQNTTDVLLDQASTEPDDAATARPHAARLPECGLRNPRSPRPPETADRQMSLPSSWSGRQRPGIACHLCVRQRIACGRPRVATASPSCGYRTRSFAASGSSGSSLFTPEDSSRYGAVGPGT